MTPFLVGLEGSELVRVVPITSDDLARLAARPTHSVEELAAP